MAEEREHALSLAFMRGHPVQAARVLETVSEDAAAALFDRAPSRLGATVLAAMLPQRAARCIAALDDARVLELLSAMGTQPSVAVLRHLPESRRRALTTGLPTAAALASTLLLGYAEDTLGAWVDPDIVILPPETRAADALDRMRLEPAVHPLVFVADGQRRLAGLVGLGTLLLAPEQTTLATLMRPAAALLAAHAPLSGTLSHLGWEQTSLLPVVEPGDRLVGVITRDGLARALRRSSPPLAGAVAAQTALPSLLARGYWQALSGLIGAGLALLPRVPPLAGRSDGR